MFRLKRFCLFMIIIAGLVLPVPAARATVDVTTGFVSERKTTFISLYHEDASPMPLLVAELAQNVDALDNVFHRLQNAGRLLPGHPVLAVEISDDAYQRLLSGTKAAGYAVLSLENEYRLDLDPHDVLSADTIALGPVYRIQLALWPVSVNELFTLAFLLPELSADQPRMELLAAEIRQHRDKFDDEIERIAGEWSYSDLLWSPDGNILLSAAWLKRRLHYQIFNFAASERMALDPLEYYLLPPAFTPDSRFIVSSSQTELRIVDVIKQRTAGFSLRGIFPDDYRNISIVQFAANKRGDTLFFSLFGWGMPYANAFLWRSADPGLLEMIGNVSPWEKPELPGETWSDFLHRRHAAIVKAPAEFAALKGEMAAVTNVQLTAVDKELLERFGAFYSRAVNYPQNSRLAILIEGGARLEARVLALPSLKEIDTVMFTLVPEQRTEIPGRIAGISLFNVAVTIMILLMAAGLTKLIFLVKQKFGRQPAAPMSKTKKLLLFAGALLLTLLFHFAATIACLAYIDDNMGERASSIAQQAIEQKYAGPDQTVEFTGGFNKMTGSSPLVFVDFPYQALYWRLSGFTRFAAPIDVGFGYNVFNRQGHIVKRGWARYYVLGENRLFVSHLPAH